MKLYGKAEATAQAILDAFKSGSIPAALANVFIQWDDDSPCRKWSWTNQLLTAIAGHDDARGFRQWQAVGRSVKKGEKSFQIFVPLSKKVERENGSGETETGYAVYGFKTAAVFGYDQTEGEPIAAREESKKFVDSLPLIEVAREWGLSVATYCGNENAPRGKYSFACSIALGVENLSTWTHELMHAADDRIQGGLKTGQQLDQEVVAEFGGAVLLEMLGMADESDRGGCWEYVAAYAASAKKEPLAVCQMLLDRTCKAVALIMETAAKVEASEKSAA